MKRIFTFSLFLLAFASGTSFSQDNSGYNGAYINQIFGERYQAQNRVILENDVFLRQAGNQNTSVIEQNAGPDGANLAIIRQHGAFQEILLNQFGSNNRINFKQSGRSNSIDVKQQGDFISSNIHQTGHDNLVKQELGRDNTKYTIIQHGNNWGVIDQGFAPNNPGYTIKQTGMVGITVTIEHN